MRGFRLLAREFEGDEDGAIPEFVVIISLPPAFRLALEEIARLAAESLRNGVERIQRHLRSAITNHPIDGLKGNPRAARELALAHAGLLEQFPQLEARAHCLNPKHAPKLVPIGLSRKLSINDT